jgi:alpha-L-rhamnosidase
VIAFDFDPVPDHLRALSSRLFEVEVLSVGHLTMGFIGTPRLLPVLRKAGLEGLAGQLLLNEDEPSWLFPVTKGATTIWERWNSWTAGTGFADRRMNSFNHYAFGAVGSYLFGDGTGIWELSPGYGNTLIAPVLLSGVDWLGEIQNCPRRD